MTVLSDSEILDEMRRGRLKIEGFQDGNLTPNGYDVTVEEVWIPNTRIRARSGDALVPGNSWFVIGTKEYLALPSDIVGEIWIRTTWARRGVLSSFGRIDAGFKGNLTFSAFNASEDYVRVPTGDRFAQVVFERLGAPARKGYGERSGNYQGQRGITLAPSKRQKKARSKP